MALDTEGKSFSEAVRRLIEKSEQSVVTRSEFDDIKRQITALAEQGVKVVVTEPGEFLAETASEEPPEPVTAEIKVSESFIKKRYFTD